MGRRVYKFGSNAEVDLGQTEDVIITGGDQYWPAANATTTLVSSSVEDAAGGDGLQLVTVTGIVIIDGKYVEVSEEVVPEGQGVVTLDNEFYRSYLGWGDDVGVTGVNEGNIDIKHGANILARIGAGDGRTLQAMYTVPEVEGRGLHLTGWDLSVSKGGNAAGVEFTLLGRPRPGCSWRTLDRAGISSQGGPYNHHWGRGVHYLAPGWDVRIRVTDCSANDTACHGGFDMEVEIHNH